MTGDNNNILASLTPATMEMLSGLGEQQLSTILMCGPDLSSLLGALLPSSLHEAGAAAAGAVSGQVLQPVIASGAPLSAPPSIDNRGGNDNPVVDYRNYEALGGATGASEQSAASAASSSLLQQSDSDEIVILGERPAHSNYAVCQSSATPLRPPSFASFRTDSPLGTAPFSAPSPAPSAAAAAAAVGASLHHTQTMLLGGIAGLDLPLLVPVTAGGAIVLNDLRLPSSPDSPQNTLFSTTTSSGVSSGASPSSAPSQAAKRKMATLKDALISNGEMQPKQEPLSHEGSETGLDLNGRPPVPLCSICSADSTGIHFGVEACAACSAFFRRTVVLSKNYECQKGGDCVTHKDTSGSARCRACRFKKCLTVGMDRGAVQHRRDAIGKVSQIKKESSPGMDDEMTTMMNGGGQVATYHHAMMPSTSHYIPIPFQKRSCLDEWMARHLILMKGRKLHYTNSCLADAFDDVKDLYGQPTEMRNFSECIFQLWKIEPRLVASYVNENGQTSHLRAYEKAALFRNFFLSFQAVEEPYMTWHYGGLEKEWWVMPNRMFFSFEHINDYFAGNVMSGLNLDMATAVRIFIPSFQHAMELVARPMADLGVTYIEMVALSGVIYLDPMAPGITEETQSYLHKARGELIANILRYYREEMFVNSVVPDSPEVRLSQLLNISAGVKIHAERTRENMQILSLFDVIPVDNMFNEMCNIVTAYNDETRSKLRARAIKEDLVDMERIYISDVKWKEYNRLLKSGEIERGSYINQMNGEMRYMTPPVFERDDKIDMKFKQMIQAAKKEEPDQSSSSSSSPSVPPAAMLAVAAVSAPHPPVPTSNLPIPFRTMPPVIPPMSASTLEAIRANHRAKQSLASLVSSSQQQRPITVAAPVTAAPVTTAISANAMVQKILDGQHRANNLQSMQRSETERHYIHNPASADQWLKLAELMSAADANVAMQLEQKKAAAAAAAALAEAQQQLAGPSTEKKPRLSSVVDSGTNPATPPSNSQMMAAIVAQNAATLAANQNAAAAALAAQQSRMSLVIPYDTLLQQQHANNQQQLLLSQHQITAAAAAAMTPVTLHQQIAQLQTLQHLQHLQSLQQQQQQQQQQHPF